MQLFRKKLIEHVNAADGDGHSPSSLSKHLGVRDLTGMGIAAIIGAISACIGLLISFHFAVSTGAAIVLTCTAIFGIIAITKRRLTA